MTERIRTHNDECWRWPDHEACAVRKVQELLEERERLLAIDARREVADLLAKLKDAETVRDRFRDAYHEKWAGDVEIRLDEHDDLDEIVGHGVGVHIEALGNGKWFANIGECRFNIYGALFTMEVDEWAEEKKRVSEELKE